MKTKKRVPEIIRKKMAALLRVDENYSAHFLKHEIEKELDEQWSIGDCERYNIPDNMIPIIMEKKKI